MVYADKPTTLEALKVNISRAINKISPEILEKVVKNWTDRMRFVTISRGSHMLEINFKTWIPLNLLLQKKNISSIFQYFIPIWSSKALKKHYSLMEMRTNAWTSILEFLVNDPCLIQVIWTKK